MSMRNWLTKYSYLIRIVMSITCMLCIPALLFGFGVISQSYQEMMQRNEEYYYEAANTFMQYFDRQIDNLRVHAMSMALDKSGIRDMNSKIDRELLESNPYYFTEAINALTVYQLSLPYISEMGIYFEGADYVVTSRYKYALDDFLSVYSKGSDSVREKLADFFQRVKDNGVQYFSSFGDLSVSNADLMIGVPINFTNQGRVLVFYMMQSDSINMSFYGSRDSALMKYYIFRNDNLMYTNDVAAALINEPAFETFLQNPGESIYRSEEQEGGYTAFKVDDPLQEMTYLSIVPVDAVEQNLRTFYQVIRNSSILILFGFLGMLILTIYINYRPIRKLMNHMGMRGSSRVGNEISTIEEEFGRMEEEASEQRILLMDYLLGNLLYGIPISRERAGHLDDSLLGENFCVITLAGVRLDAQEREELADSILKSSNTKVYITEILLKGYIVLICVISNPDVLPKITKTVREFFRNCPECRIGVGDIVNDLNDVHDSYLNSVSAMENAGSIEGSFQSLSLGLGDDYPADKISQFLQYVQNGEESDALHTLEDITCYLEEKVKIKLLQRYICYDLLTAYIRSVNTTGYGFTKWETEQLISNSDMAGLKVSLEASVAKVCAFVKRNKEESYHTLEKQIMEYVNQNFMDTEFCRTQIAEHFGVSVYAISRLFKDSMGIGLKEYVTAKRIELAREILLTTDKTIVQISNEVGFANPDYFSKVFKANYGVSPSKFRSDSQEEQFV